LFTETVKAQGKNKKKGKAHQELILIQKLYRVEKQARWLAPEDRHLRPLPATGAPGVRYAMQLAG